MQDFVVIKLYLKLNEEKNLKEVTGDIYSFITMPHITEGYIELIEKMSETKAIMQSSSTDRCACIYNIKILKLLFPELQLINNKAVIQNQLKDLLGGLKKFKVQNILALKNKKIDNHKTIRKSFHACAKLIANDSDADNAFKSMHESIITKIKDSVSGDWII